jgi:hypothetical protein
MEQYLSTVYSQCAHHFEQLLSSLQADQSPARDNLAYIEALSSAWSRFRVWAENVGAAHSGKEHEKSLDYRLRYAAAYKDLLQKILLRIDELLLYGQQAIDTRSEDPKLLFMEDVLPERDIAAEKDEDLLPSWSSSESDSEVDTADGIATEQVPVNNASLSAPRKAQQRPLAAGNIQDVEKAGRPVRRILDSLNLAIASLFKIPIRTAAPLSRLDRSRRRNDPLMTAFEHFDHQFVTDLYPQVGLPLATRFSAAITRRRCLLQYRKQHNEKLKQDEFDSLNAQLDLQVASKAAKSHPQPHMLSDMGKSMKIPLTEGVAPSSFKATTFKPTQMTPPTLLLEVDAVSEAESISTSGSSLAGHERFVLPPRPKDAGGEDLQDFECPFCYTAVHIRRSQRAWK